MKRKITLSEIEVELAPILSAIYGKHAHCRCGATFLYIWWGKDYSVYSERYNKKQAMEIVEHLRPIIGFE
jgi:hypothetical protein